MASDVVMVLEIPGAVIQFANLLSAMEAWAEEAEMPDDVKIVYDAACKFADALTEKIERENEMSAANEVPTPLPLVNRENELMREIDVKMLELTTLAGEVQERFGGYLALERSIRHDGKKVTVEIKTVLL